MLNSKTFGRALYLFVFAAAVALPFLSGGYILGVATFVLIYLLLSLGLNVVIGFCGLLALGFAAFYGIGAYVTALLFPKLSIPLLAAAVICGSVLFGLISGAPVLRLRGDYLAIVTLGFGEITRLFLKNMDWLTNGPKGISGIYPSTFLGLNLSDKKTGYLCCLAAVSVCVFLLYRLKDSKTGRAWAAIREDEVAASSSGIDVTKLKILAFLIGAAMAGLAGFFFAVNQSFVDPNSFGFDESVLIICMIVIGGIGSIPGVLLGTVILVLLPEILRNFLGGFASYRMLLYGVLLVCMMLFRPQGILPDKGRKAELLPATENIKEEEDSSVYEGRGR